MIIGFWIIKLISKGTDKTLDKAKIEESLKRFLLSLINIALKALLLISVASMLGVATTSFVAVLGAAGLAVGLSLQGSLSNFAGGVLIILFKPFKVGDVIDAARELMAGPRVTPRVRFGPGRVRPFEESTTKWYVRLRVVDAPGVLAAIAGAFGDAGVSLKSVWQEGREDEATLLVITHDAVESNLRAAVRSLDALDVVSEVAATIRVQSDEP